jgi:multiple sugar transport system permease protein
MMGGDADRGPAPGPGPESEAEAEVEPGPNAGAGPDGPRVDDRRADGGVGPPEATTAEAGTVGEPVTRATGPAERSTVARLRDALANPAVALARLRVLDVVVYAYYAATAAFFAFPVLWVVSVSFRPEGQLFSYPFRLVPTEVTLSAYRQVFRAGMPTWLFNSVVVTLAAVAGVVAVAVPAAYAFSRFEFRGRRGLLGLVLLFQMISAIIIVVPLYSVMSNLGLLRTRVGLVLLYLGVQTPFSIWLLKGYFDEIPRELDQAARIDGCNRLQTLRHVLLRPIAPGIAVIAIFNAVLTWSEFVLAYTVLGTASRLHTISIGVFKFQGQFGSDWQAIAAASVVGMVPLVVVFVGLQRYFTKGLVEGSLKG